MSPTPAPITKSWPTQAEAAAVLGTGERTIRRWIDAGKLRSALRPVPGRKPVVIVDPGDVERLRVERLPPAVIREEATLPAIREPDTARQLGQLLASLRPWLNLDEASSFSGLPKAFLLRQARAGTWPGALDVGKARGGRWRFRRDQL